VALRKRDPICLEGGDRGGRGVLHSFWACEATEGARDWRRAPPAVTDTGCRYGATHFRGERETMAPEACGARTPPPPPPPLVFGAFVDGFNPQSYLPT